MLLRVLIKWQTLMNGSWWRFLSIRGPIIFVETAPAFPRLQSPGKVLLVQMLNARILRVKAKPLLVSPISLI